jgi:hypothetical protein
VILALGVGSDRSPRQAQDWVLGQFRCNRIIGRVVGCIEVAARDADLPHVLAQHGHRLSRRHILDVELFGSTGVERNCPVFLPETVRIWRYEAPKPSLVIHWKTQLIARVPIPSR